jgi:hypothetical protein
MNKLNQLNFILHLYSENAKVARVPCNFILHNSVEEILKKFQPLDSTWLYTFYEVEHQGNIIKRGKLSA